MYDNTQSNTGFHTETEGKIIGPEKSNFQWTLYCLGNYICVDDMGNVRGGSYDKQKTIVGTSGTVYNKDIENNEELKYMTYIKH